MVKFNRWQLFLLKIRYTFTYTMTGYLKWKKKALGMFSTVHDLDTLARIIRRKIRACQESKDILHTALIGGGILIIIIKFITEDFVKVLPNLDLKQILIVCLCCIIALILCIFFVMHCNDSISFYEECLTIIDYLDKHNTK